MELWRRRRNIQKPNKDKSVTYTNEDKAGCTGLWTNETLNAVIQIIFLKRSDIIEPLNIFVYPCVMKDCHDVKHVTTSSSCDIAKRVMKKAFLRYST